MRSRRIWLMVCALVALGAAALALTSVMTVPAVSSVVVSDKPCLAGAPNADCLRFPVVTGASLSGIEFTLPDDFAGDRVLVIVPFDRDQQVLAADWLPLARSLAETQPQFSFYSVAVFTDLAAPMRALIRTGMNAVIGDTLLRDLTITVFLEDRERFLEALAIPDVSQTQVLLLNGDGEVLWRGAGQFSEEQGEQLRTALMANR